MLTKLEGMKADIEIFKELEIIRKREKKKYVYSRVKERLKYVISKVSTIVLRQEQRKKKQKEQKLKNSDTVIMFSEVLNSEAKKYEFNLGVGGEKIESENNVVTTKNSQQQQTQNIVMSNHSQANDVKSVKANKFLASARKGQKKRTLKESSEYIKVSKISMFT